MKSERRHELKENKLAHELGTIRQFLTKYSNWIIGAVTAAVVVWAIFHYYTTRRDNTIAQQQAKFDSIMQQLGDPAQQQQQLADLGDLAEHARDPLLAERASLEAGNLYAGMYLQGLLEAKPDRSLREMRQNAQQCYQRVLDNSRQPLLQAQAHLGLGILAEDARDMDAARKEYTTVAGLVKSQYPVAQEAQWRLTQLDQWKPEVVGATSQPTSTSAPAGGLPATGSAPALPAEATSAPASPAGARATTATAPARL
jgi:predicted negative regulator of RcsB-dependent stress response